MELEIANKTSRTVIRLVTVVILLGALWLSALLPAASVAQDEILVDRSASGPFSLLDPTGRAVTDRDFRGRFMLVFFGYSYCPDVCPTDLQVIGEAMDALGEAGDHLQPIFISLDPTRDTGEMLAAYVKHFHPRLLGLTGTPQQVAAAAAQTYGVFYMKVLDGTEAGDEQGARYTISHTALTYLLGPDGHFLAAFPHASDPREMAAGILAHLNDQPS